MNIGKLLGPLPFSGSSAGKLNAVDLQKIVRLGIVVFLGAFVAKFSSAESLSFVEALQAGGQAGVSALGASTIELVRRFIVNNLPQ